MSNLRVNSNRYIYIYIYIYIVLASVFGVIFLFNFLHIFTINSEEGNASATSAASEASVAIAPSLSIIATDATATIQPEASGNFTSATSTVTVSSNNKTGYSLYLSSNSSNVDLVNVSDNTYKVSSISSNTTESALRNDISLRNHYGFTTDNNGSGEGQIASGTYLPVTSLGTNTLIKKTDTNENVSTTNVTFSTTVDKDLPSGTYTNEVLLTAIANTNPNVFMQDFTAEECNQLDEWSYDAATQTLHEGDTITLWDRRDNNSYKVRRLADGNCWMVEGLKLAGGTTIDSTDSDIEPITSTTTGTGFYTLPVSGTPFDSSNTEKMIDYNKSDLGSNPDPAIGAWYSWVTATAGTGSYTTKTSGTASICPKNWTLPTGGTSGQFQNLYNVLGSSNNFKDSWNFVATGDYYNSSRNITSNGYWWSRTANPSNTNGAYNLNESTSSVRPADDYRKYDGMSVRCLLLAN